MKSWLVAPTLGVLFALSPAAADEEALTNEDVVKLTQAGLGPSVIVAKIASSQTAFETSVEALVALSENEINGDTHRRGEHPSRHQQRVSPLSARVQWVRHSRPARYELFSRVGLLHAVSM